MSEVENGFNVEEFLTASRFTIPVILSEQKEHVGTAPKKRTIHLTYQFSDEIASTLDKGRMVDDPEDSGPAEGEEDRPKKQIKTSLPLNDQLALLILKVDGVETEPNAEFWKRVVFRYKKAFVEAILNDVYPNVKTSTGS